VNSKPLRVLVTAAGGDFGQAIIKALRFCEEPIELHGCDLSDTGIGGAFVDSYHVVPAAKNQANYVRRLDRLCRDFSIDAVVPASEAEIAVLGGLNSYPKLQCGTAIVCQHTSWVETYGDKLNCMRALEGKVALAAYADGGDREAVNKLIERVGFPVVVKSRRSRGSRSLHIVDSRTQLEKKIKETGWPLVQQFIDSTGGEFSVGVYACLGFRSAIIFKRQLGVIGCSWFAETSDDSEVREYAETIAGSIDLKGSANIQVRKGADGVRLLEINTRFSSLVAARAFCGFRDAEWSVLAALGRSVGWPEGGFKQIRFRRFIHELIDDGEGFHAVPLWQPRLFLTEGKEGAEHHG